MADSAVGDDVSSSAHKKRLARSKELLDPGTKPGDGGRALSLSLSLSFNVALFAKYRFDEQAEGVGGEEKGRFSSTCPARPAKDFQS